MAGISFALVTIVILSSCVTLLYLIRIGHKEKMTKLKLEMMILSEKQDYCETKNVLNINSKETQLLVTSRS